MARRKGIWDPEDHYDARSLDLAVGKYRALVCAYHENNAIGASVANGSFKTTGVIVAPCSMKTVTGIVPGYSDDLLLRAVTAGIYYDGLARLAYVSKNAYFWDL